MKITVFQSDTLWLDKATNLAKINDVLQTHGSSALVVLPEMFNTGYIMDPLLGAEKLDGYTIQSIIGMLKNQDTIVCGSIPVEDDGKFYNTFVFVGKHGLIGHYAKQHLFGLAGESEKYTSGSDEVTIELHSIRVKPLICYDLRFPYISYNKENQPYDMLIYSANWPKGRISQWEKLLMARAIENQCFVIGVNRAGTDANGYQYTGQSMIVDYMGDVLVKLDDCEQIASYDVDFSAMYTYRTQFPFLEDRKIF
jgi:omega-amidase